MQNTTVTFIPLPFMGLISINGPDAVKFLQGQLSCDLNEVTETVSRLGAYCNQQGKVYTTFRIFRLKDSFYLWLPKDLLETVLATLKKYVIFSKVTLADCSVEFASVGYLGRDIENSLTQHYHVLPAQVDDVMQLPQGCLIKLPGQQPRYLLISESVQKTLAWPQASEDHWKLTDIQAGIPIITAATSAEFTPHALNYHLINGVSFTKGCYIGQEIIARTQYRGQVKQHLYQVKISSPQALAAGDKIVNQQQAPVGTIINIATVTNSQYEALAVIQESAVAAKDVYFGDTLVEIQHT